MRSFGTQAWTPPKAKATGPSESSTPAWQKATTKQASTVYLNEDENDIAAMFFGAGSGGGAQSGTNNDEKVDDDDDTAALFHSAGGTTTDTTSKDDDGAAALFHSAGRTTAQTTSTDDEDAAALFFAGQEESNDGAKDDDSSSSEGSRSRSPDSNSDDGSDGGQDDSSRNSDNSGSGSDSSQKDNDDDSRSSRSSSSSNSSNSRSGGSASGSDDDDHSQSSGSSRSSGSFEEVELSDDDDGRSQSEESNRSDGSSRSSRSGSSRSGTSRHSDRSGSSRSDNSSRSDKSGSSRSDNSSRSERSRSSSSRSERDDNSQSNTSRSSDRGRGSARDDRSSGSEGSSRSKSSRSSRSSKSGSDSESRSERSDDDESKSDASSRSSTSDNGSKTSGDAQSAGESDAKDNIRDEAKDAEKKEGAKGASVPKPAKSFPKPVNTKPVKSFPKVETSSTPPAIKAPDVKSKAAYVKPADGMAPWQSELKKRKETGAKTVGWKKPKKEESTIYVEDDEDDIAALFFEVGGGKPKSAKFSFGGDAQSTTADDAAAMFQSAGQTNAATENNADDAAAKFQSAGQTNTSVNSISDDDAAAMFQSAGPTEAATEQNNNDDAAAMFQSVGQTETTQYSTSEYITPQTESQEPEPMPVDLGDEEFVEGVEDEGDDGDEVVLEEVEEVEEIEEGEEVEEEIILEEDDEADAEEELIIEVEEEYVDDETVATSNEQEVAERLALEERRLAQHREYAEMEGVESMMRNYIATLAHDESARSIHSDQSSVPWGMATNPDHDPAASYASYIQAARERQMDDQSSYFKPDMEMPSDDSIAETDTFASSEQRSIPWGLEVRESDSWANPMRPLQATRKAEALQPIRKKENINTSNKASMSMPNTTNPSTKTSSTSRKAPNRRKRRAPTGFGEMVSAEVFKTSVPDPERETELWYHPGFAFLAQHPNTKPYFPPTPRTSQSNSLNGSEDTDKAVVSDLEIAQLMYNNSVPASSNVTLLSYGEKTISQWNMLESSGRRADQSFSSSKDELDELKLPDFSNTIFRTASPWTPNGRDSESSSDSLSYTMLVPFEDEGSDEEKRRNVVFSRSGSSVSIDLEVETFEYVPEPSFSLRPESESTLETGSVKSTRRLPCGIYGFMSLCFCLVLVPASVAIVLFITGQNGETAPRAVNPNFIFPTRAPTMAPTNLNGTMERTSDAPSSGPLPIVDPIPTLQPTVFDTVMEEPVTEDLLFRLLASVSVDNGDALRNRRSPQFAALEWLRSPAGFNGVSNDAIFLQRYALATLYYSTAGESWTANDQWLSDADVCDWFSSGGSLLCNNEGMVTALTLTNNGLNGNLPNEIGILSRLETIMLPGNTNLTGPVPRSLQNLANLQNIFIEGTGLSALPPKICDLPLQEFWANCEELGCNCCNECFF